MHVASVNPAATSSALLMSQPGKLANLPQSEQVKAVSAQFEAVLLRQFLQESIGNIMGGKEAGAAGGVYGFLLTDVLANQLSQGGGLGMSKVLQQQLSPRASIAAVDEAKLTSEP